jgi:hypothetical protein
MEMTGWTSLCVIRVLCCELEDNNLLTFAEYYGIFGLGLSFLRVRFLWWLRELLQTDLITLLFSNFFFPARTLL